LLHSKPEDVQFGAKQKETELETLRLQGVGDTIGMNLVEVAVGHAEWT
jgi:hypothetical protein